MRIGRVRTRAGFGALASGQRARRGAVRLTAVIADPAATPAGQVEVAYAVGRAVGTAVVRNRIRRRLRAAISDLGPRPGTYLLSVTPAAAELSYAALRADLAAALEAVGALERSAAQR